MNKHTPLAWLTAACALLAAACLLLIGPTTTSRAEPMLERVVVDPLTLTVSEPSGSGTFTLTLTSQPIAVVSVALSASNNQCAVTPNEILLDAANWDTGVSATATAVDDFVIDGPQNCSIITAKSVSADPNFNGLNVRDVRVTVLDDDVPGITVVPTAITVAEPAGSAIFTLTLTSQPIAPLSIPLLSTAPEQCTVSPISVTLTAANWATGVTATVTAVDDQIPDGTQTCVVETGPATSSDPNYDGLYGPDVIVTVEDSNLPAVVVVPTTLTIAEPDGSDTFTLTLTKQPIQTVSISLSSTAPGQCTVSPGSVSLNSTNWDTGVNATVTAVDDHIQDGTQTCLVETGPTSSTDPNFNNLPVPDVTVTVLDYNQAGVLVFPTSLTIAEPTGSDVLHLSLTSQPNASVSIPLSAIGGQCTVSPGSISLNATNWDTGVTATVTAVDDLIADGSQTCLVRTGPTSSTDSKFRGLFGPDVTVTVDDNDAAGIIVVPTNLTIAEPAGSDTFALVLTSEPIAAVSISLLATGGECTVSPNSVTLDAANWDTGVTATVTAVDDPVVDGSQPCSILTGSTSSTDPNYADLSVRDVQVTVLDDDVPGLIFTPPSLTVWEPAGSAIFTLTLTSQPIASVLVALTVPPPNGQCTVSPLVVAIHPADWTTGVTATVTAVDDQIQDGTQSCPVQIGPTSSADPDYDGLEPYTMIVTVHDIPKSVLRLPLIMRRWPPFPDVPTLQPIANADGDGNYTVSWTAAAHADSYVLEESKCLSPYPATEIYSGPSTGYVVDGQGPTRYCHRVKARNVWGESGWSSVKWVDVLWEKEPNDDALTQANGPIVSGLTYYGTFPNDADIKDYFYFALPTAHSVELWLTNIPAGQDYSLVLRDHPNLNVIGYSASAGNASEHILTGTLPAGRYYVQVYHASSGGSTQPYHLKIVYQ